MKTKINVTIDPYILSQAREKGLNVSQLTERAVVQKLNPENEIDTRGDHCEYCGKAMRQATPNDMNGLYWILPDEKWICPTCEHSFVSKIVGDNNVLVSKSTDEHIKEIKQEVRECINLMKNEIIEQIKNKEMNCL